MNLKTLILCSLAGAVLAIVGITCLVVSELVVEGSESFVLIVGSHHFKLDDHGLLGDLNTYKGEWGALGVFCLGAAVLLALFPAADTRAKRELLIILIILTACPIALLSWHILS